MKARHIAVFFLYLITCDYALGVAAAVYGPSAPLLERKRRQSGCRITPQLQVKLDNCFKQVQYNMPDEFEVPDQRLEDYELSQGAASGFQNFQWRTSRCSCERNAVRIFVRIDFLRILISFVMNLLDDLLGGLLGPLGTGLSRVLGNVVNLVVRILALQIEVEIVILQRFIPGTRCVLESYRVIRVTTIRLLGLDLAPVAQLLSPLLTPIVNALLHAILNDRVKAVFRREIERMIILRTEVIC